MFSKSAEDKDGTKYNNLIGWVILGLVIFILCLNLLTLWIFKVMSIIQA